MSLATIVQLRSGTVCGLLAGTSNQKHMTEPKPSAPKSSGQPISCKWIADDAFTLRASVRNPIATGEGADPSVLLAPKAGAGNATFPAGARPSAAA